MSLVRLKLVKPVAASLSGGMGDHSSVTVILLDLFVCMCGSRKFCQGVQARPPENSL